MVKKLQQITLLCFLISLSLITTAFAAAEGTLTVFSTSDVHGSVIGWNYFKAKPADVGLAKISTIVNQARAGSTSKDAILLIDAGDIIQGTPLDTYMVKTYGHWKHHPMFTAFNQMGYDAIVLGNHEFNFGTQYLKTAIGDNKNVLSANTVDKKTGKTWSAVKPYLIRTVYIDGAPLKVGILGMTTPAIPNFEAKEHYAGLQFDDEVATAKKYIQKMLSQGVDLIITACHTGVELEGRPSTENQIIGIAKACPQITLLIAAHNHVVIDNKTGIKGPDGTFYPHAVINGVSVVESGKDGKFVACSKIRLKQLPDGKWKVLSVKTEALPVKGVADDPKIVQQVMPWHKKTLQYLNEVIGTATGTFSGADSNLKDTALIDLINKVQCHYAGTQLSAAAAFNPNACISKGKITRQEIAGLYLYENYLYGIKISGKQLRAYLEHAAAYYGKAPNYNYDMIEGVNYTIDMKKPVGQRIVDLTYQGKPVRNDQEFTLAINDYRFNGGGGYMAAMGFTNGKKPPVTFDSMKKYGDKGQVRSLIENYIINEKTISPQVDNNWRAINFHVNKVLTK